LRQRAARLLAPLIIDAEVVHLDDNGVPNFDALHRRTDDEDAVALAFDLLLSGDDIRRQPLIERKKALQWVLRKAGNGIQYVEHAERDGEKMFASVCKVGLEGIVSKRATSIYKSGRLERGSRSKTRSRQPRHAQKTERFKRCLNGVEVIEK
jgi:bifunctional non-homologous end joining protein LigD